METTARTKHFRRIVVMVLGIMLTIGMIPATGLFDGSKSYAAIPADGTGWTASGADGLKYFQNIYGTGTQVTTLNFGQTLYESGSPYYITKSITLKPSYPDTNKRTSALKISGNVKIILLNNSTLTVQGGRALGYGEEYYRGSTKYTNWDSNMGGAGAGIELTSGNILTVDGRGTINATGGEAGDGQKGESPDGSHDNDSNSRGYNGGKGGRGGGGAGAGIGTKGGAGSTDQGYSGGGDAGDGSASASGGGTGGDGKPSGDSGTFIQYGNVNVNATGGAGGRGGDRGDSRWESQSYRDAHGGGGGGGGAGSRANHIGSGGPGGGAGGGGGGGAVKRDNNGSCAGGSGGGGGGGWTDSQAGKGGQRGAYDTEKGNTNSYGKDGKDAGSFGGSVFAYGKGGARVTASSARGGKGGRGGNSGTYGNSGTIVGTNTGNGQNYRITVGGYNAGGRNSTYCVAPKREITIKIIENASAKLNPDGKSYLYKGGTAVAPTVVVTHVPTGTTMTEDNYNSNPRTSKQDRNYYTEYNANNTTAPPSPNPVNSSVTVYANARTTDQGWRKIVNNNISGGLPSTAGTLKTIPYQIDYETYQVTLDAAGGIGTRTVDVKLGNTNGTWGPGFNGNQINAPTREGFVFGGFYTEKNGSGIQYYKAINGDVSYAQPIRQWTTKGNGTLYAKWTPLTYKIRFWSDYGEGSEYVEYNLNDFVYENPAQQETSAKLKPATYGDLVLPSAHDLGISRDHYDFVGWNIYEEQDWAMYKAGKTYKAGLTTKQDDIVNIYAAWRAKDQLTVSYDANGGSGAPPVGGTWADSDYQISNQIPVRDGYTFKGWNSAASPEYGEDGKQTNGFAYQKGETVSKTDTRAITSSTTLYAQWERNPSVSYRANGGSLETSIPTRYPAVGSPVTIAYEPIARTGYEYVGWLVRGSSNNEVYVEDTPVQSKITIDGTEYNLTKASTFDMPSESVVLEALWTPQKMEIDYITDSKGGEPGLYDLDGWYYADEEGVRLPETTTEGIKTVTPEEVEYDKPLSFQVVVDRSKVDDSAFRLRINDINIAPEKVIEEEGNDTVTYKFSVAKVRAGQMIQTAGLEGKSFPVILDANEGELRGTVTSHTFGEATALPTTADSTDPETGEPVEGNTPVRKGFAFEGWFEAEEGGEPVESIGATAVSTAEDGTLTYHARWVASKYNIAYDIGPLPGEEGSTIQWQDNLEDPEETYKADVSESDQYQEILYSASRTLPVLSNYVKYEYGARIDETMIKKVEAQFLGWSTKKGAAEPEFSSGQTVRRLTDKDDATVTLYPVWGAPHYRLVLDANGGKVTEAITGYRAGSTIDLTEVVPVRPGYAFGGWYGEKLDDDADVTGKTAVTSIPASEFGNKAYYAYWTAKEYKYTLKGIDTETGQDTGETWQPADNIKVGQTATLVLPDEITPPTGKVLAGWTERYNPVEVEIPPASEDEDPTVEIRGYVPGTVLFAAGEETADLWTTDDEGELIGRELYPVWKNDGDETLLYDANGGQEAPDMVEATRGTDVDIDFENAPVRKGYIFAGYDTDKTRAYDSADLEYPKGTPATITLDTTKRLYAIWEPIPYDITFDAALGEGETGEVGFHIDDQWQPTMTQHVAEFDDEVALAPADPSRGSMYEFLGWSTVKNGQVEYQTGNTVSQFADVTGTELAGKTLYAVWLTKDPAYLSFDAMGGIGAPPMETHPQGKEVSVKVSENRNKPTYHGYTFKGWGTSIEDPAGSKVDSVTMPNSVANTMLYAIWEKNQSIRLVYDGGSGATGSVPTDPTSYYEGETAAVLYRPAPARTGFEFIGWNVVNKEGETVEELRKANEEDNSLEITEGLIGAADQGQLVLEAAFKANAYTVKFNGNGAKSGEAPAEMTKTYGDGEKAMPKYGGEGAGAGDGSLVPPTGFAFAGWNTEKDGSGKMLQPDQVGWELSSAADDEVTLYAIWTAASTTVTFDNGDSDNYDRTFEFGQVLPDDLDVPEKTGYDFKYYYIEEYAHDDDGQYLDAEGQVVENEDQAEVKKVKYYDESMEPQRKWGMTADDLRFQVGGGDKFNMKAEWEAQTYMISYHDDKGVLVSSQEITYGKDFRVADASDLEVPSGYRHVGWKFKNDPEQLTPDIQADKGITPTKTNGLYNNGQTVSVYAVFQEIRKFKVSYDANGGTDAPQDNIQYEPGEKAIVSFEPVPKRANYDFLGWTTYSNTSSVLPGGENAGKYYADSTIDGVETIDGYTYHYGDEGGSDTQKEINIEMRNDVKFYAVWVQKTYYTVDFYGNSTSNGGEPNKVTAKSNTFTGPAPDSRTYTKSASGDGFRTDEAIFRSTSPYKGDKSTKITLPDGSQMFNNTNAGARFMGWDKNADAKVAAHAAGDVLEDITMDENIVLSAVWAYPVTNVTLKDIDKPVYEQAPSEDVEATAASGVAVTKSTWSPSTDQFAAGTKYKFTVKMKASDGYYFDAAKLPMVKMNVDGIAEPVTATATLNTEGNVLTAVYTFEATENIVVNGDKDSNKAKPIAFTDVTAPEAGKKLDNGGNAGDSRVDSESWFPAVEWTATDAEGQPKEVKANAEPDTIYTATLRIKPAKGYEFKADTTKVTFGGEAVPFTAPEGVATKAQIDAETGELIVTYVFPKTAAVDNVIKVKLNGALRNNQTLPPQTITTSDIVDEDSKVTNADWYILKNGELIPVSAETTRVTPNTTYVAQVTLKPADGYAFEAGSTVVNFSGAEMTVQGKDEETTDNNWAKMTANGSIRVSHAFTSPGEEDTTIALKLSGLLRNGQNLPDQTFTSDDSVHKDSRAEHITWFKVGKDGSLTEVDSEKTKVSPSTTYVAQVTLRPATGYTFEAGSTKVSFGGEEMTALAKSATPEGNNWVQMTENGSIKVSHEFTSSEDVLQEIVAPADLTAEFGTAVSTVNGLPREVTIVTEDGKKSADVHWVDGEGKVAVVTDDGDKADLDGEALNRERTAHDVTIRGVVDIPEGVTVPQGMTNTTTLTIHVAEDARIDLTLWGIRKTGGKLVYDAVFPSEVDTYDGTVLIQDRRQEPEWLTEDNKVKSAENYIAEVTLRPAEGASFRIGKEINFDGVIIPITTEMPERTAENQNTFAYAVLDQETGAITVGRTYRGQDANFVKADAIAAVDTAFGTEPDVEKLGLPVTDGIDTDDPQRGNRAEAGIEWDLTPYANDYNDRNSAEANRKAHEVEVTGTVVLPEGVVAPEGADLSVSTTIKVAADPRLEKEAAAAELDEVAKKVIEEAQALGVGEEEIAALEDSLQAMRDEVSPENLANSTADSDQEKIDAVNTDLEALKKVVQDRKDQAAVTAPTGPTTILNTIANSAKKTNDVIWDKSKVKGATNFEINWKARGANKWASKSVGNVMRGTTTGLTIGGLYEIRVRPYAVSKDGQNRANGAWSNTVYRYFHTTGKIRLASNSKGSFTMSWGKNSAATGYQVMFTTNKNGSGAANNINTLGASATSFTKSGLKSGTTYYVQVRELKKVGSTTYVGNISIPVEVKVK